MKKEISNISGVTLIELLIGVVISVVMMAAMFTSYNVVNNTYSKITDTAKMSQAGRETLGMIMKDIRMAGFKYFGDNIPYDANEHIPILITKQSISSDNLCDRLEIVYGDYKYDDTLKNFEYKRYKVTYQCKKDGRTDPKSGEEYWKPPQNLKILEKKKEVWKPGKPGSFAVDQNDKRTHDFEDLVYFVQDLIFAPIDENGKLISPPPSSSANASKVNSIKIVDVLLSIRSKNEFFRLKNSRVKKALHDSGRDIKFNDKYMRETMIISAHARNLGF